MLRIPFRQLRSVMVLVLLDEQGRAVAPPLAAGPELAPERGTIGEAGLDELSKRIPGRIKVDDQPDGRRVLRIESEGAGGVAETTSARFSVLSTGAGRARGQVLHRQRRRRCAALGEGALDLSAGEPGAGSTSTVLLPAKAPGLSSAPGLPVAGS